MPPPSAGRAAGRLISRTAHRPLLPAGSVLAWAQCCRSARRLGRQRCARRRLRRARSSRSCANRALRRGGSGGAGRTQSSLRGDDALGQALAPAFRPAAAAATAHRRRARGGHRAFKRGRSVRRDAAASSLVAERAHYCDSERHMRAGGARCAAGPRATRSLRVFPDLCCPSPARQAPQPDDRLTYPSLGADDANVHSRRPMHTLAARARAAAARRFWGVVRAACQAGR
jgi:hypothetical protein